MAMVESKQEAISNGKAAFIPRNNTTRTKLQWQPYSLLCMACKTLTTTFIILSIMALIFWLVFLPEDLKVHVESASLTRFELSQNHTLYYNFSFQMSLRNPNKKLGIHYKHIQVNALYGDSRFGFQVLSKLHQSHKSTMMISPVFRGQALLIVNSSMDTFAREKEKGFFYIGLKLYTKIKLKMLVFNSIEYRPDIDCYLRLPVPGTVTGAAGGFMRTRCDAQGFS